MKKRTGLLLLAILALCLPVAANSERGVPPEIFPPTLAAAQCASLQVIGISTALGVPDPLPMNHCSAQQTCPSGCYISCTGHTSCTVQATSVTCDSVVTPCPYPGCTPPSGCLNPCDFCECKANFGMGCLRNCTE